MKDYSAFIWPAYGVTVMMFAALIWTSLAHARRWKRKAQERGRK